MGVRLALLIKLAENLLCQRLAELNTPLVETVDVPNGALREGQVLIVDNQSTQSGGCDLVGQDGSGRSVTQEGLVGHKLVGSTLSLDFIWGLADHKSLSLCEEIGGEHLLVLVLFDGVVALSSQDEISGNELGALVEELVERVLGVGGWLTKQDGTSGVLDVVAAAGDGLAVGLHGELLEVGREAVHVLVVAGGIVSS